MTLLDICLQRSWEFHASRIISSAPVKTLALKIWAAIMAVKGMTRIGVRQLKAVDRDWGSQITLANCNSMSALGSSIPPWYIGGTPMKAASGFSCIQASICILKLQMRQRCSFQFVHTQAICKQHASIAAESCKFKDGVWQVGVTGLCNIS